MPKDTRKVIARIRKSKLADERKGKGDHLVFTVKATGKHFAIDSGKKQMDDSAYKRICELMGWGE